MNESSRHTNPSWHEVLTEQGGQLPCSENSRKDRILILLRKKYNNKKIVFYDWEEIKALYKREIALDFGINSKIYNEITRKEKFGYPKKCPVINKINNLIIFL